VKRRKLQGTPRLSKGGKITRRGIDQLSSEIEGDDDAHPDDIRAAVRSVYESLTDNLAGITPAPPNPSELAFLCLAFSRYLDGGRNLSLDQAFGLVRSRTGHPGVPARERKKIARAVWEQYLKRNDPLEAAAITVGAKFGKGKTQILKFFHDQFFPGYLNFMLTRLNNSPGRRMTQHETRRFLKLRKHHERRELGLRSTSTKDSATVTRNKDGMITVEAPWLHRHS
jgi:hypothetical protein